MPTLTLLMGLPGVGKTRYAATLNGIKVELDLLRKGATGSYRTGGNFNVLVHQLAQRSLHVYLSQGKSVVIDGLFLTAKGRKNYIHIAKRLEARVEVHWLDTPYSEVLRRNEARLHSGDEKAWNPRALERCSQLLEFPSLREGIDDVLFLRDPV